LVGALTAGPGRVLGRGCNCRYRRWTQWHCGNVASSSHRTTRGEKTASHAEPPAAPPLPLPSASAAPSGFVFFHATPSPCLRLPQAQRNHQPPTSASTSAATSKPFLEQGFAGRHSSCDHEGPADADYKRTRAPPVASQSTGPMSRSQSAASMPSPLLAPGAWRSTPGMMPNRRCCASCAAAPEPGLTVSAHARASSCQALAQPQHAKQQRKPARSLARSTNVVRWKVGAAPAGQNERCRRMMLCMHSL
jgi:hypothetical protein